MIVIQILCYRRYCYDHVHLYFKRSGLKPLDIKSHGSHENTAQGFNFSQNKYRTGTLSACYQ